MMSYKTVTFTREIEAVDIPTMDVMSPEDYREYLEGGLLYIDHHDILRSVPAGYPIAVNREQLMILIEYLDGMKDRVKQISNR